MNYAITITGPPYSSQAPQSAYAFCVAALAAGHNIDRVFLYGDGVFLASGLQIPPRDEPNWNRKWHSLIVENAIPVTVCVTSALRRGIIDEREARRHDLDCSTLSAPWAIAGLGDWIEMTQTADRHLLFSACR